MLKLYSVKREEDRHGWVVSRKCESNATYSSQLFNTFEAALNWTRHLIKSPNAWPVR